MDEYRVLIPKEYYSILNFKQEGMPGVAVVNTALRKFEPKEVFAWHLSLMLCLEDLIDNGMPSKEERKIIDELGDTLDSLIKGENPEKPNALFLARITWNATREIIWRVYDPEVADTILKAIIEKKDYPRGFDYRMEYDEKWELTRWHLKEHNN